MNATVVDLRYRTRQILKALDRREHVNLLYRGTLKGRIVPAGTSTAFNLTAHPFFGMHAGATTPVSKVMRQLRAGRYRAL